MQRIKECVQAIKDYIKSLKDYRHWIMLACIAASITLIPFFFQYAHLQIWESCVAFGNSFKYYISELLGLELHGEITVNDFTEQPFELPLHLPRTWEEFKLNLSGYWTTFFSMENFSAYMGKVADVLFYITKILLIVMPVFLIWLIVSIVKKPKYNNDYAKESKALRRFKRFELKVCKPVKNWFVNFVGFVQEHDGYLKLLAWIWAYSFNIISIIISFFAYFLYFSASLSTTTIYVQLVKLLMDLSVMIDFIPGLMWAVIGIVILNVFARKIAYDRLDHHERCNRGFLNERGILNIVDGPMGLGKTLLITDMALSAEVKLRDMALEVIIESDFYFPNFPWINFELFLKKMFRKHRIYDVWSCRRVIRSKYLKWQRKPRIDKLFGYDYERYGLIYNDELKDISVWQAIEDYACAYLIYTRQCSLLISNYSIRSDNLIDDLGNFPLWNTDFFKRDSRLMESYSRHSHILDYDMLRLGKVMDENNPRRYAFGFGVYVISEIDKERQNSKKLRERAVDKSECNQLTDLFELNLMMGRHAVNIANRCFLIELGDLQRFEELGIATLGLAGKMSIESKTEGAPVLPFFSTFWLFDLVAGFIINKFDKHYLNYRHDRGDYTLPMYLMKNIVAKLRSHRERVNNLFGCSVYNLIIPGCIEGEILKRKWFEQYKKSRSGRYASDCLSGLYWARGQFNTVGIHDMEEYDELLATDKQLLKQHSFFQYDVHKVLIK